MFINSIYPKHPDTNNEASNSQQQKLFPGHHFNYHRDSWFLMILSQIHTLRNPTFCYHSSDNHQQVLKINNWNTMRWKFKLATTRQNKYVFTKQRYIKAQYLLSAQLCRNITLVQNWHHETIIWPYPP